MRSMFLDVACILAFFDIGALANEKLEANFDEEHLLRYVTVLLHLFCDPGCMVFSVLGNLLADVCLKETNPIQVQDKTSLRYQLEAD